MMQSSVIFFLTVLILVSKAVGEPLEAEDWSRVPGRYGGELKAPLMGVPRTFNPLIAQESSSVRATEPLFDSLLRRNLCTLEWESRLALPPQNDAEGRIWTFQLRPDLYWSDGQPITADDVIFTADVIYDEEIGSFWRDLMLTDISPAGTGQSTRQPLKYQKLDTRTIQFTFPAPHSMAREMLSFPIVPKHKLERFYRAGTFAHAWNVEASPREIISSGPFILESYTGRRLVYRRNPRFWKKDEWGRSLPYLAKFEYHLIDSLSNSPALLKQGVIDVVDFQASQYPPYRDGQLAGRYRVFNLGPSWSYNYLAFNQNPDSPAAKQNPSLIQLFQKTKFRRAISHAIQRDRAIKHLFENLAQPLWSPVSPADTVFHNPDVPQYPYNPGEARRLLSELGLRDLDGNGFLEQDGEEIRFTILTNIENSTRRILGSMIMEDLHEVGLKVEFEPVSFNALVSQLDGAYDWQAVVLGFGSSPEPYEGNSIWLSSGTLHVWHPRQKAPATSWEAEIDESFRSVAREHDESKRRTLYHRWQVIMAEQLPLIYLPSGDTLAAARLEFGNLYPCSKGGVHWNIEKVFHLRAKASTPDEL